MPDARILMVDDDREFCEELSETLAEEGYRVTRAHDGATGRELAGKLDYDVLLLDLRLPLVSGFEILESLKPHRGAVGIIVMSGYPMKSRLPAIAAAANPQALLNIADRVFQKPFDVPDLLEAIRSLVDRAGKRPPG